VAELPLNSGVAQNRHPLSASTSDEEILAVLRQAAGVAHTVASTVTDWSMSGAAAGQYRADVAVNNAVLEALGAFGCGILSEESGTTGNVPAYPSDLRDELVIVVDPLDGSTNASRGIPWYATSLCAVDARGPRVSLIANLAPPHTEYVAIRGGGAWRNGARFTTRSHRPDGPRPLHEAVVGISGPPPASPGWWQFRALGAAALDLCLVAEGSLDAYMDCDSHGVWDYLGALLICEEAGATIVDAFGRELSHFVHGERRTPVAASSPELAQQLAALRSSVA
jgi:fructose-1,6-bisphosphatase/inositol monophosphatase family enzyme